MSLLDQGPRFESQSYQQHEMQSQGLHCIQSAILRQIPITHTTYNITFLKLSEHSIYIQHRAEYSTLLHTIIRTKSLPHYQSTTLSYTHLLVDIHIQN